MSESTPALDALLKEVEAGYFASARDMGDLRHTYPNVRRHNEGLADGLLAPTIKRIEASTHAPRLAAMLRVAVEAARGLTEYGDGSRRDPTYTQYGGCCPREVCFYCGASDSHEAELKHDEACEWVAASAALARIERIAAGESGPPEGQAMAKGEA